MTSPRSFYVLQPTAATNEAALGQLLGTPGGRRLDIAIAYVTNPGVTVLETAAGSLAAAQWSKLEKRVLGTAARIGDIDSVVPWGATGEDVHHAQALSEGVPPERGRGGSVA